MYSRPLTDLTVGFTRESTLVSEGVGSFELCVAIFIPDLNPLLREPFQLANPFTLQLMSVNGTAGMYGYAWTDLRTVYTFNNHSKWWLYHKAFFFYVLYIYIVNYICRPRGGYFCPEVVSKYYNVPPPPLTTCIYDYAHNNYNTTLFLRSFIMTS